MNLEDQMSQRLMETHHQYGHSCTEIDQALSVLFPSKRERGFIKESALKGLFYSHYGFSSFYGKVPGFKFSNLEYVRGVKYSFTNDKITDPTIYIYSGVIKGGRLPLNERDVEDLIEAFNDPQSVNSKFFRVYYRVLSRRILKALSEKGFFKDEYMGELRSAFSQSKTKKNLRQVADLIQTIPKRMFYERYFHYCLSELPKWNDYVRMVSLPHQYYQSAFLSRTQVEHHIGPLKAYIEDNDIFNIYMNESPLIITHYPSINYFFASVGDFRHKRSFIRSSTSYQRRATHFASARAKNFGGLWDQRGRKWAIKANSWKPLLDDEKRFTQEFMMHFLKQEQ